MRRVLAIALVCLAVMLTGCSTSPDREEADARAALRMAEEAEAEVYAATELRLAQSEFDRALQEKTRQDERFTLLRSFGAAKEGFIRSRELAEAALTAAQENRAARGDDSQRLFGLAMRAVEACSDTLAGAPRGSGKKGVKVDLAMFKDDILLLGQELEFVRPYLTAGLFDQADSVSRSISERATALQEEIVNASRKKKR